MVVWPTRTPGTSVIAFNGPGESTPGAMPRSRARGFDCATRLETARANRTAKIAFPAPPALPALFGVTSSSRTLVVSLRRVIEVGDAQTRFVDELRDARHLVELDLRHFVGVRVIVGVQA